MVTPQEMPQDEMAQRNLQFSAPSKESSMKSPMAGDEGLEARKADKIIKDSSHYDGQKVGRNDPCPCGATTPDGKPIKYKNCHGK